MYSRQKAVEYAHYWWNKRNPRFYNFDDIGGDCTNFVSQCLYYGGIEMSYFLPGWFYDGLDSRSPSWAGVEEFYIFATSNSNSVGVKAKAVDMSQISVGDVVQMRQAGERFNHSMLVTKINDNDLPQNIFITCHTNDAIDRPLSSYKFESLRFLKILNT